MIYLFSRRIQSLRRSQPFLATQLCRYSTSTFDTHALVNSLKGLGLSPGQSKGVLDAVKKVMDDSFNVVTQHTVTQADAQRLNYAHKVEFAALKADIDLNEKKDVSTHSAEFHRLQGEIEKLKQRLKEEISRTQAGVRLDLSLEKGRMRDESSTQELKLREVNTRMESDLAAIRAQLQSVRWSVVQSVLAVVIGVGGMILTYLRILR